MAKIRPLEDRVVIQQIEAEEKTAGGIVLPDTAKEKPQRGRVLSVGPGKLLDSGEYVKEYTTYPYTVWVRADSVSRLP